MAKHLVDLDEEVLSAAQAEVGTTTISVLHYDADFDLIAEITGQSSQLAVPAGTLD